MKERMLVTGGAGFIGSNFVRQTLNNHSEYQITVVDALTYAANPENLRPLLKKIDFVEGDICDEGLMDKLVCNTDVIVNFAGESHVDNSLNDPNPFIRTNILGTYALLGAVRKYDKRLHHISTDEVFGSLPLDSSERFNESSQYKPSSPYAATKASSDMLVQSWVKSFGVRATVSNCANNYGPYQHVEKFIPRQITNILTDDMPKLYGSGLNIREWTHVDDHNAAVHKILERGRIGEAYIIGGDGDECSIKGVLSLILEIMNQPPGYYQHVVDRPGHDMRYATDSTKIRSELGWSPQYNNLRDGLSDTIDWYTNNRPWWEGSKKMSENKYKTREKNQTEHLVPFSVPETLVTEP